MLKSCYEARNDLLLGAFMKIMGILFSILFSTAVYATTSYICQSSAGDRATLSIQPTRGKNWPLNLHWEEESHSAASQAFFLQIENAPYSTEKGFLVYALDDFYKTEDSFFYLKIEPGFYKKSEFRIVEGLDHDDHEESRVEFNCKKSSVEDAVEIAQMTKAVTIKLSKNILDNSQMNFVPHANALAMNIQYQPILELRTQLAKATGLHLNFFDKWNPKGEAHITTLTPPEMEKILANNQKFMTVKRVDEIAKEMNIQNSRISVEGLGSGRVVLNGVSESTFFVIVKSPELLKIRQQIYNEYVINGGDAKAWNPTQFYPHITVGFTARDLHESDGVLKDMEHSADKRFFLDLVN